MLHGQNVEITGEKEDFYEIKYEGKTGYVSKEYIDVSDEGEATVSNEAETNTSNETSPTENKNEETTTTGTTTENTELQDEIINTKVKLVDNAKMYALPLLSSPSLGEINKDSEITVISTARNWAYILSDKGYGWITLNKLGLTTKNSSFETPASPKETTQTQEETKKEETPETTSTKTTEYPKTMYVNATDVILRSDASTSSTALKTLDINTEANVQKKEGDWYKVTVNGTDGYIASWLLSDSKN